MDRVVFKSGGASKLPRFGVVKQDASCGCEGFSKGAKSCMGWR
jgi:hypothetical protein